MSGKRFEYDPMTPAELVEWLRTHEIVDDAFARIIGVNDETVRRWRKGEKPIPHSVALAMALISAFWPASIAEARRIAAERIRADLAHPERGEYPYLNRRTEGDE